MRKIALFIILLCFVSCGDTDTILTEFKSKEVIFPKELSYYYNGADTTKHIIDGLASKMVVYTDSTQCSSCQISRLYEWKEFIDYSKWTRDKFSGIFIFSPKSEDYSAFVRAVKNSRNSKVPILLDKNGDFAKQNSHIPKARSFHAFLLDKNNKVVVVGNPMGNEKLWELYKRQISAK